jgi:hypothetical protein
MPCCEKHQVSERIKASAQMSLMPKMTADAYHTGPNPPHLQAGYMTAPDQLATLNSPFANRAPATHDNNRRRHVPDNPDMGPEKRPKLAPSEVNAMYRHLMTRGIGRAIVANGS